MNWYFLSKFSFRNKNIGDDNLKDIHDQLWLLNFHHDYVPIIE